MRGLVVLVLLSGSLASIGCATRSAEKTMLPKASATVVTLDGAPVEGAVVTLVSQAYPNLYEKFRTDATTNRDGVATFPRITKWRVESLGMHGEDAFIWNWCVRRDGYATVATFDRDRKDFDQHARFTMLPGESTPCPAGP